MHPNPFSPSFSIRPDRFYGRKQELLRMDKALDNSDSPERFLFVTGTRGCGKTSLLHQYASIATSHGWTALETTYQDALEVMRTYGRADLTVNKELRLAPSVSAVGVSASLFGTNTTSEQGPVEHLANPLVSRLLKERHAEGLFVTIDEIQKISERDMEEISYAVQAAKTRGLNIALVLAGLPASYQKIRQFRGCTFVQRMKRHKLGMMDVDETIGFLHNMFALVPEINLSQTQIDEIAQFSSGHPYLLQLLGNYIYEVVDEISTLRITSPMDIDDQSVREAERRAIDSYRQNVLRTVLSDARRGTREYLRAMYEVCDDFSTASTSDIAQRLGKTLQECSSVRARVIDLQLVDPIKRGMLQFSVPYLALVFNDSENDDESQRSENTWSPRTLPFQ